MIDNIIKLLTGANPNTLAIILGVLIMVILVLFRGTIELIVSKKYSLDDLESFGEYLEKRNTARGKSKIEYTMKSKIDDWKLIR